MVGLILLAPEHCFYTMSLVLFDLLRLLVNGGTIHRALAAENLFLRKQLALFQERKVKPRRADNSTRWIMATLSRMFDWRGALTNVKPDTLIRWHRIMFMHGPVAHFACVVADISFLYSMALRGRLDYYKYRGWSAWKRDCRPTSILKLEENHRGTLTVCPRSSPQG
jgi:hypothetical protein